MKRILSAALALSLLGGSAALAQPYDQRHDNHRYEQQRYDNHRYEQQRSDHRTDRQDRREVRRWARGERLPANYRVRTYYVDYRSHHLRRPPHGYQWVRVNNDYMLVALTSGLISQIIAGR
jgi:Ni/Co efflux regulator RcnB